MDEKELLQRVKKLEEKIENMEEILLDFLDQFSEEEEYVEEAENEENVPIFTDNIFKNIQNIDYKHGKGKEKTQDQLKSKMQEKKADIAA